MSGNAVNRSNEKAYLTSEAAKYHVKPQHFTYDSYVLIFYKNMRILSGNNEEMWDAVVVQKFL